MKQGDAGDGTEAPGAGTTDPGQAAGGVRRKGLPWDLVAMLVVPVIGTLMLVFLWPKAPPLQKLYPLPGFSLTAQDRSTMTLDTLRGKVWVANFIFTTCPGPCLMMTQRMAQLQRQLGPLDDVRLISFTVDPDRDTPEVLKAYAEKHGAIPGYWFFLTGPRAALYELAQKGFKVATVDQGPDATGPDGQFLHSTKMVIVDRDGFVRGYFDGVDTSAVGKVAAAVRGLRREAPAR